MSGTGRHCGRNTPVEDPTCEEPHREPKEGRTQSTEGRIAAGAAGAQLLELNVAVGNSAHSCVALVDSGASHCFLSESVA